MYNIRMKAYEGSENYIFVSYAHKDSETVWPIIDRLSDMGYRIWFDDGIAPGSEWPEYIAEHLDAAAAVLAFISPNSVESPNCRREIHYSLGKEKPFIYVMLEKTELTKGLELQLSAQNGILKHNYPSEEKFFTKLSTAQILAPCLAPKPAEEQKAEETAVLTPAAEPVQMQAIPETPAKKEKKSAKQKPVRGEKKKGRKLIPVIIAAVLLAAVAVGFVLSTGTKKISPAALYSSEDEVNYIDPQLVGQWRWESNTKNGDVMPSLNSNLFYANIVILPDGTISLGNDDYSFPICETKGKPFVRIEAENGITDLFEAVLARCVSEKDEKAAKCENVSASYSFITASEEELQKYPFLSEDDITGLVIHYTGTYREDAFSAKTIDVEVKYNKRFDAVDLYYFGLYGNWTDGSNIWSFDYTGSYDRNSIYPGPDFAVKTAEGKTVRGDHIFVSFDYDTYEAAITFYFKDSSMASHKYDVESMEYNRIVLRSDTGDLELTRVY